MFSERFCLICDQLVKSLLVGLWCGRNTITIPAIVTTRIIKTLFLILLFILRHLGKILLLEYQLSHGDKPQGKAVLELHLTTSTSLSEGCNLAIALRSASTETDWAIRSCTVSSLSRTATIVP